MSSPPSVRSITSSSQSNTLSTLKTALTDVQKEVRTLVVRYAAVRVIRVLTLLHVDHKPLVLGLALIQLERVVKRLRADKVREAALARPVELLKQETLDIGRPALVEPKVGCVGVSVGRNCLSMLAWKMSDMLTLHRCQTTSV